MKTSLLCVLCSFGLLTACGGDDGPGDTSGVDQSKPITELSTSEVSAFCEWSIAVSGGPGHETQCGDGVTVTVDTQAECEGEWGQLPAACSSVTVGEMEACTEAIAADPCVGFEAEACAEFLACLFGS